jgi:Protein of unknown function (DUF1320)
MAWLTLTTDQVINSLTQQEQSMMTDPSSSVDLANIVQSVTALVRGKVFSWRQNQTLIPLALPGTIPDELLAAAISIARFKFLTHLPGTQLITVDRRADKDEAYAYLDDVASGEMIILGPDAVTVPSNPADTGGEPYFKPYPDWQSDGTPAWGGYW